MSACKLTYFNIPGLAEPLRILLNYAAIPFEDYRINLDDWPKIKSKMPMEQVPILEINGKVYHQTRAMGRYFAKKCNIYGTDSLEAMEIDASVDDIEDWRILCSNYFREDDVNLKAKLLAQVNEKTNFSLKKFEERVGKNGGHFVGNKISWADIHFMGVAELISTRILKKDLLQGYPELAKLYDTVRSIPNIKSYIEKRTKL